MSEAFAWSDDPNLPPRLNKALKALQRILGSLQTSTAGSEGGSVASLRIPRHQGGNYFYDTVAYNNIPSAQRTALATAVMASHNSTTPTLSLPDTDGVSVVSKEPSLSDITTLLRLSIAKSADELRLVLNDAAVAALAGYGYSLAGTIAATSGTQVYRGINLWEPYAVLMPHATNTLLNVLDPSNASTTLQLQGGTLNSGTSAYENAAASQRHAFMLAAPASATGNAEAWAFHGKEDMNPHFDALFAPNMTNGTSRWKNKLMSYRMEAMVLLETSVSIGQEVNAFFGYFGARVAGSESYGIGFHVASTRTGNLNWWASVIDYSGGGVGPKPMVADQVVWQNSGVTAASFRYLAIEVGQSGGTPYVSWQIDGVEVYKMSGNFPTYPDAWGANAISPGMKVFRDAGNSADLCKMHIVGPLTLSLKLAA